MQRYENGTDYFFVLWDYNQDIFNYFHNTYVKLPMIANLRARKGMRIVC